MPLRGAALQKKCERLVLFQGQSTVELSLQQQVKTLTEGDPRLLEWLDWVLQDQQLELQVILDAMNQTPTEFRESILAETLLKQQSEDLRQLLTRMQVFELPVPYAALLAIEPQMDALEQQLQRGIVLGLVECSVTRGESLYGLSRILIPVLEKIQEPELYRQGLDELYRLWWTGEGGYSEEQALELYRLAGLAQAKEIFIEVGVALGNRWSEKGRYREAILMWEQTLAMRQKLLGNEHLDVAQSLNNLAVLYDNQGRYEEAEPLYKQALQMRQKLLGNEHLDVATSLNNLAVLCENQGRYQEAEPLYKQALMMYQNLLGNEHLDVAISLNNLALLYKKQSRYEEAEPLYKQALAMIQKLLSNEHLDVAISLNNLAGLYRAQGRHEEAEPLYKQVLAMRQKLLGNKHPDVATSLNNLAVLYYSQGRYEEAEPLYKQALTMRQKLLGNEHPDVAASLNNLATLYQQQGKYPEAKALYRQGLVIANATLGPNHPLTQAIQSWLNSLPQSPD